jgi:hypothetical protein
MLLQAVMPVKTTRRRTVSVHKSYSAALFKFAAFD